MDLRNSSASVAAAVLRNIPSHKWRKRFAKRVGPWFDGCIAKTAYGFPMRAQWQNNVNRIGFEGSYGIVERFILSMPADASYIDIGANQGFTSIMAAGVLKDGKVTCFEPSRATFDILSRNILLNGLRNVQAINRAVSDRVGEVCLDESDVGNTGGFHISSSGVSVPCGPIGLDAVWDETSYSAIYAKIDTEGYELDALRGMEAVLASGHVAGVVVEVNAEHLKRFGATVEELYRYLAIYGLEPEAGIRQGHYDEVFRLRGR